MPIALRRTFAALLTAVLVALALLTAGPTPPASAHAALERSEPSADTVLSQPITIVTIWFTEPLENGFSAIQVLDMTGARVDNDDSYIHANDLQAMSVTLQPLANGTYTVAWQTLSLVDGHSLDGSFVFAVGEPIAAGAGAAADDGHGAPAPAEPVARGLLLLGGLTIVGGLGFERLILQPVFFGPRAAPAVAALGHRLRRRAYRLLAAGIVLFALASLLQLGQQTSTLFAMRGGPIGWAEVTTVARSTAWGRLWLWRMGLLAVAAVGTLGAALSSGARQRMAAWAGWAAWTVALGAGLGFLATLSLTSHAAAAAAIRPAALSSDYLHLLAAAFWVGGLFHFAVSARPLFSALEPETRRAVLAALVPRFSRLALLSVGTVVITGLYSAWVQVAGLPALATPYGLTLLAKLALFVPMLALGAVNLLWITPRLRAQEQAGRRLRRTVSAEALLGAGVLLAVGWLVSLEPARQSAARMGMGPSSAVTQQATVERTAITLAVAPAQVGANRFRVALRDAQDRPVDDVADVVLTLTNLDVAMGDMVVALEPVGPGAYESAETLLSVAGNWQADLLVRRDNAFDARHAFRFAAASGGGQVVSTETGFRLWGIELALLGLLFVGVGLRPGRRPTWTDWGIVAPGGMALLAGLFLAGGGAAQLPGAPQSTLNPTLPHTLAVAQGEVTYRAYCERCHGLTGLGDGPDAAGLAVAPANLIEHVPHHDDAELFTLIADGRPPMPTFRNQLSDDEIWVVITFLRALAAGDMLPVDDHGG